MQQRQLVALVGREREVAQREVARRAVGVSVRPRAEIRAPDGHAPQPVADAVGPEVLPQDLRLQAGRHAREGVRRRVGEGASEAEQYVLALLRALAIDEQLVSAAAALALVDALEGRDGALQEASGVVAVED